MAIDFSTFIFSLGSSALIYMGVTPNPQTKKMEKNLDAARQNIEILSLLQEKTKGNLTQDEQKLMENLLHSLRMNYVDAKKKEEPEKH